MTFISSKNIKIIRIDYIIVNSQYHGKVRKLEEFWEGKSVMRQSALRKTRFALSGL